jgi:hypothetical protein
MCGVAQTIGMVPLDEKPPDGSGDARCHVSAPSIKRAARATPEVPNELQ